MSVPADSTLPAGNRLHRFSNRLRDQPKTGSMVHAGRAHAAAMEERADDVLAAGRAAAGMASRVQEAVLALLRARDPIDCVSGDMPGILAVDAAHLCMDGMCGL